MIVPAVSDNSLVGRWWWTVDRWTLLAVGLLAALGAVLVMAASPAVADRIGLASFHFVQRQLIYLGPALALIVGVSLLSPLAVRRLATLCLLAAVLLMLVALVFGVEINGARRWLSFGPFVIQPSEFVKPCLAVITAWMFAEQVRSPGFPGQLISALLLAIVLALLMAQPDFGMAVVVATVWCAQFFMAGVAMAWIGGLAFLSLAGAATAYALLPHVASRIDRFLDPAAGDSFQVDTSLEAFRSGGLFGRGPGEGTVKSVLPDAHTDFIFAVAGEEFGLIVCLFIVLLFAFIVLRGFSRMLGEPSYFVLLATSGLLIQFGMQAVINMGVNLRLMPAKGMTLPFISYGGSSLIALALTMGMVLAFTRRRDGRRPV